ncbi:hypothetical protein [Deinococcus fonticola]|uniref:hypothetical protein n=1 Tax=Deinococcus fonticola TaxID=2528713 RepID=UPI001074B197|nr:hypothetical protein [Deinococcus fonticola]
MPCLFSGTLIQKDGTTYTFTRTTAGSLTTVPAKTRVIVADDPGREHITIIWSGRNDYANTDVQYNIAAMRDAMRVAHRRYLVLSIINAVAEPSGSSAYNSIAARNAELKRMFGHHYLDVRSLINAGTADDTPASANVSADGLHLNDTGYGVVAQAVFNEIVRRGW